jgi:hypothetical protein
MVIAFLITLLVYHRRIKLKNQLYNYEGIVLVSTLNAPDGLFERIEKEAQDTCLYKRYS